MYSIAATFAEESISNPIVVLIAVSGFFALAFVLWQTLRRHTKARSESAGRWLELVLPYKPRSCFLSQSERSFYEVVRRLVGNDYVVFAKVRLTDLLTVPAATTAWQRHFGRIAEGDVDFLICDVKEMRPRMVIDLQEVAHVSAKQKDRDLFLDDVFAAVGVPFVRVRARSAYGQPELRQILSALLVPRKAIVPPAVEIGSALATLPSE